MGYLRLANYFAELDNFAYVAIPLYTVLRGTGFNKSKRPAKKLVVSDWTSQ